MPQMSFTLIYFKKYLNSSNKLKHCGGIMTEDKSIETAAIMQPEKKKRGRKPKNQQQNVPSSSEPVSAEKLAPKKRGRKPKGGIFIHNTEPLKKEIYVKSNIILHLKCFQNEIPFDVVTNNYLPTVEPILPFNEVDNDINLNYTEIQNDIAKDIACVDNISLTSTTNNSIQNTVNDNNISIIDDATISNQTNYRQEISEKIKKLQYELHINSNSRQSSCCFWCTEPFTTPTCYIPEYILENKYHVYGSFCSPSCALAFLLNEKLNDSLKFERCALLNMMYGSLLADQETIKPAPNPYYTLNKFMGTLSIEEYRRLNEYDKTILTIDKPITRQLPQIFEDNENYSITSKTSRIKSFKTKKNPSDSKTSIVSKTFGC